MVAFEDNEELHLRRTGSFVFFGCILGPFLHPWFNFLGSVSARVGGGVKGMLAAVALDQSFMPPLIIAGFWLTQPVLEGKTFEEGLVLMDKNFWTMLKGNYIVWPAAQAINFTFVPPNFRVLFVNMVSLGWNSFVSYLSHRDDHLLTPQGIDQEDPVLTLEAAAEAADPLSPTDSTSQ